jgi:hypothetical protein
LFFLDQELILKPLVFWPKFGSDEVWVRQLLIEHVNNKSPVTQEEMEYALCWRQNPVVLFPLKEKEKRQKEKNPKTPSNWDLLSSLPPLITLLFLWFRHQSHPRLLPLNLPLLNLPPPPPSNSLLLRLLLPHLLLLILPHSTPFSSLPPHSLPETRPY